jgi:digeranylgeranylglycerophospholipid reductase
MKEITCDILVIGAGPSGSSAAWSSVSENLDVVILDEKEMPGKEACAETLSKAIIKFLPFKIPEKFLKWELKGLKFYYKDYQIKRDEDIWWKSYPLNRSDFDPFVLNLAIKEGADFLPSTRFVSLQHDQNYIVKKVIAKDLKKNKFIRIIPKILISAEGVEYSVLKSIDQLIKQKTSIGYIKSFEYKNLDFEDYRYGHIFFGEYADGAYAYIFPKSKSSANIGIATLSNKNLDLKFNKFLEEIKFNIKGAVKTVDRSGKAPIKYPSEKMSYGNILFTGDAANQNLKPFVEGIIPGIICGSLAGKTAFRCISDFKKLESTYKKMIYDNIGEFIKESDEICSAFVSAYENKRKERFLLELGIFSYVLNAKDFKKLKKLKGKDAELYIKEKLNLNS